MTHAWSILVVLSVSAVMFYAGVFEATARPRFEGLGASSLQLIPDQVKLYSDGVVVLTVLNMRPYSVQMDYVEVAPIADRDDVIRTTLDIIVGQADYAVFQINASNVYKQYSAFVLPVSFVSAVEGFVDFNVCLGESYAVGGTSKNHVVCGNAWRIEVDDEPSSTSDTPSPGCEGSELETDCACACTSDSDCLTCQECYNTYPLGDPPSCADTCMDTCSYTNGPGWFCLWWGSGREGHCFPP